MTLPEALLTAPFTPPKLSFLDRKTVTRLVKQLIKLKMIQVREAGYKGRAATYACEALLRIAKGELTE